MTGDLPDYTTEIVISLTMQEQDLTNLPVIPRPKGGVLAKGDITTGASYVSVAEAVITSGKQFQITKILVSCTKDVQYKLVWDSTDIGAEVIVPATVPFTDWFPWDYYLMLGNGSKKIQLQAKYPTGGEAGTCHAEINGEEITP